MSDYLNLPDADLLYLLKQGHQKAFEVIYERYFLQLLNTAYKRLRSRDGAAEIVQDVFVQFFVKRHQIEHIGNLEAYLHTLLKHKVIDRYREQLTKEKHYRQFQKLQPALNYLSPEPQMDGKLLEEKLVAAVNLLPAKCREVFVLSRLNHLSHQAIADKLNISVSTVEKHIGKALRIMREEVKGLNLSSFLLVCCLAEIIPKIPR